MDNEERLGGGNATHRVTRAGATVRKPWTEASPSVAAYMTALRLAGIDVPEHLGQDEQGRQVLEFIPGRLAMHSESLTPNELARVGALVRAIHDVSATYRPAVDAVWQTAIVARGTDLVCHNDLAPWNLIVGDRWVFIDWDSAAPSTRLWDVAYAAQTFTLSNPTEEPEHAAINLAAFVDGYNADYSLRVDLPAALHRRVMAMYDLLESSHRSGTEPWASMFSSGHGDHWRAVTEYVARHQEMWVRAVL